MIRVLFLDTRGCCRSPIAACLARQMSQARVTVMCAGLEVTQMPDTVAQVLREEEIDPAVLQPVGIEDISLSSVDLVVTLSDEAARHCPMLPGMPAMVRWDFPELNSLPERHSLEVLRDLRDNLRKRMQSLMLPGWINAMANLKRNNEVMMDHIPEGLIVHTNERIITAFNHAAERITGYNRDDVIGRDCHEVFEGNLCGNKCSFCEGAPNFDHVEYPMKITTRDGAQKRVEMSVRSMRDEHGQMQGVLACLRDVTEVTHLRQRLRQVHSFHGIIGNDEKMHVIYELIGDLAVSDCPVLIQGESGTGKELVAAAIHEEGRRAGRAFVPVNCGALPEGILESELFGHVKGAFTGAIRDKKGRFELADGGTIFLDEVGELSPSMQVKLLRVLQEHSFERVGGEKPVKIDVRILSATNRDLREMVQKGRFREDLFYRLCVVPLTLPPLRERRNDIVLLVRHFIERLSKDADRNIVSISDEALHAMMDYPWPGNIRELQNAIQYAFVKCRESQIQLEHLPPELRAALQTPLPRRRRRGKLDTRRVKDALKQADGNKVKAAQLLGVGRATLYRFMDREGVK
ncbi:MAG: sigma 54-interacting transcriptional regulator [Sedimentisphaerales bacterium]|nr:sigma 54-interacting transcriptional regulator [Sedimentisphaerales bacterium]